MGPFFVVGSDRSGTTLLRLMLNAHPRLHVPRESGFLIELTAVLPIARPLDGAETARAVEIIVSHPRWGDLELDADALRAAVAALPTPTLRDVAASVFRLSAARARKPRWGDKTPGYVAIIPTLATVFPEARFIHLIRDARDVCLSLRNRAWRGGLPNQARFWARQVGAGIAAGRRLPADRYLELAYEDLVLDPPATLTRACTFLDEAFDERMLAYHETAGREVASWESALHDRTRRPPRPADAQRWRRELTGWETFVIEALAGPVMDAVGQPRRYAGAGRLAAGAFRRLTGLYRRVAALMDRLRIPTPPVTRWLGIGPKPPRERS